MNQGAPQPPPGTASSALLLKLAARVEPAGGGGEEKKKKKPPCWLHYWCRTFALYLKRRHFKPNEKIVGQEKALLHRLEAAGFNTRQIDQLYTIFLRMDFGNSGMVTLDDFKRYFLFYYSHAIFAEYVFDLLDRDGDELLNFGEFALGLQRYCSFDYMGLIKFTFHLIDGNHSHRIEQDDLTAYLTILYGKKEGSEGVNRRLKWVMEQFGKGSGDQMGISMPEWIAYHKTIINLLQPAFVVQQILRNKTLGDKAWERLSAQVVAVGDNHNNEQHVFQSLDRMKLKRNIV